MTPLQVLIAFLLLCVHGVITTVIIIVKKERKVKSKMLSNVIAIYSMFWIIMAGYALDNIFFNLLFPERWITRIVEVFISPVDNLASLIVASVIRGIWGKLEDV